LMVRSFQRLTAVDPGFRSEGVITFGLSLPAARYRDPESAARFMADLTERLEALPGVVSAAGINSLPLGGGGALVETRIEDFPVAPGGVAPSFEVRRVTPGYFETMGIPLNEGRAFERRDHEQRTGSAIISASLKAEYWPVATAVDRRLEVIDPATIVGVVGDVHGGSLTSPPEQIIYLPMLDAVRGGVRAMTIVVRTATDPPAMMPGIREEIRRMDALLPITDVRTMDDVVGASMSRITFTTSLLVIAACVALFLGSVGVYGVISYIVTQRTGELGIRQALGAAPRQLWALVMRQALALAMTGVALGLAAAGWMRTTLSTLVYGIDSFDPPSFVAASIVILLVATAAALVPALRAVRVHPAVALRHD
jgi:putative ABC transport system permease protein